MTNIDALLLKAVTYRQPLCYDCVLNSFYTIDWNDIADDSADDNGTKQEIDIELLTKSFGLKTGQVHFAVHEAGKTSFDANSDVDLGFNPSDNFPVWDFEITPEQ